MTSPDGAGVPNNEDVGGWGDDYGPLSILGKLGQALVMRPLDRLLSGLLGEPAGSFDTVEELVQDLIPAIIRKVLRDLGNLLGGGSSQAGGDVAGDLIGKIPVVGDVVKVVQGITTGLSGALASAAAAVGIRWAQVDNHEEVIAEQAAQLVVLSEALQASAVTQAWVSLDVDDLVTFPRILLGLGVGSTPDGQVNQGLQLSRPGKAVLELAPMPVNRGGSRPRRLKMITGGGWSLFGIDAWYVGLYVLDKNGSTNRNDWLLRKVWDGGDRKDSLVSGATEYAFDMGTGLGELFPGQILFGAQLQIAPGLAQNTRPRAAIPQAGIAQAATTLLDAGMYTARNQSGLASTLDFSALTRDNDVLSWMAVTTELIPT